MTTTLELHKKPRLQRVVFRVKDFTGAINVCTMVWDSVFGLYEEPRDQWFEARDDSWREFEVVKTYKDYSEFVRDKLAELL